MARQMRDPESTDIYRQKVTHKGMTIARRWDLDPKSEPYETVYYHGPFATRNVGGNPWLNAGDTWMKVEVQKLEAVPPGTLEWVTEKEKVFIRDDS